MFHVEHSQLSNFDVTSYRHVCARNELKIVQQRDLAEAVSGDRELTSNAPAVKAAKPTVDGVSIGWPVP